MVGGSRHRPALQERHGKSNPPVPVVTTWGWITAFAGWYLNSFKGLHYKTEIEFSWMSSGSQGAMLGPNARQSSSRQSCDRRSYDMRHLTCLAESQLQHRRSSNGGGDTRTFLGCLRRCLFRSREETCQVNPWDTPRLPNWTASICCKWDLSAPPIAIAGR